MRYLCLIVWVSCFFSCKNGPKDGLYCAEIKYRHVDTGRNLTQKLLVEIKAEKLVQIVFPEGNADSTTLRPQVVPDDGKVTILSESGAAYYVTMIGSADKCSNALNATQCKGLKKNGERCQRMTDHGSGLCWQHRGQSKQN